MKALQGIQRARAEAGDQAPRKTVRWLGRSAVAGLAKEFVHPVRGAGKLLLGKRPNRYRGILSNGTTWIWDWSRRALRVDPLSGERRISPQRQSREIWVVGIVACGLSTSPQKCGFRRYLAEGMPRCERLWSRRKSAIRASMYARLEFIGARLEWRR